MIFMVNCNNKYCNNSEYSTVIINDFKHYLSNSFNKFLVGSAIFPIKIILVTYGIYIYCQ